MEKIASVSSSVQSGAIAWRRLTVRPKKGQSALIEINNCVCVQRSYLALQLFNYNSNHCTGSALYSEKLACGTQYLHDYDIILPYRMPSHGNFKAKDPSIALYIEL